MGNANSRPPQDPSPSTTTTNTFTSPPLSSQLQDSTNANNAPIHNIDSAKNHLSPMDAPDSYSSASSSSLIRRHHLDRSRSIHHHHHHHHQQQQQQQQQPQQSWPADPIKPSKQQQAPSEDHHRHQPPSSLLRRSSTTTAHRRSGNKISCPPSAKKVVTLYFTSLQGVRRTYDDCRAVRSVLRCFRVAVDERDLAMDLSYRRELQALMGGRPFSLPQVFIGRRWVGGAEEIWRMHEDGELAKALEGVDLLENPAFVCHVCGGARFVPCLRCNGSRKVFVEEDDQLKRCPVCNENGLVRCVSCY